ncbi:hypothetical protein [Natrarchaeobaculum sulfurireducens]|uniref:Uncharacterized protein n=1 Tax=Natrarchaeobaculum sulfurireducens TaxID=2044521 RepID=A0A346PMQ4_9EURY|nr:hypothetical protein [Natrarchaeobaculum sulfurireducens]AXR80799.1 hypothetical protein AArcMg_0777 [Natrarchaeobaculum sulfurireducens]
MSVVQRNYDLLYRTKAEAIAFTRALIPMPEDDADRWFRKLMVIALFAVWTVLALEIGGTQPDKWLMYSLTGILFLIVGRMWDIELESIDLPGLSIGVDESDDRDD